MTFACIAAARRFDFAAHVPFSIAGRQVGWLRRSDLPHLARWPAVFVAVSYTHLTLPTNGW